MRLTAIAAPHIGPIAAWNRRIDLMVLIGASLLVIGVSLIEPRHAMWFYLLDALSPFLRKALGASAESTAMTELQIDELFGLTPPEMLASMSGIDFLRKMFAGELPHATMMQQVGFTRGSAEPGFVVFQAIRGRSITIRSEACTADSPRRCWIPRWAARCRSMLPSGSGYTTLEFKVSLIKAITAEYRRGPRRGPRTQCRPPRRHRGRASAR